jgi:cytochrome bd ubiquinol oxidase subunit I
VVTQPYAILMFLHVLAAAYILSGFFVMGVSAYHLLRKQNVPFFKRSFRMAATFAVIFAIAEMGIGDLHGKEMMKAQPLKAAAAEAVWESTPAAPMYLFVVPDEQNERNSLQLLGIPKLLSWVALGDANGVYKGLKEWPKEQRPPVALVFWSFRLMVGLAMLFVLVAIAAWLKRNNPEDSPGLLKVLMYCIPLPYLGLGLGWTVTEMGRQPWIVYGVMKTADAASRLAGVQVGVSLAAFIIVYSVLGVVCFWLIARYATKVPELPDVRSNLAQASPQITPAGR